jgi:DNA (cytosine-5)-methyltransferase 1
MTFQENHQNQSQRRAISLFSGAGGDTLGLQRAGFTVVAFSENNKAAIDTHQAAFPHSTLLKDPTTGSTDIKAIPDSVFEPYKGQVEAIFAGFPCFPAGTLVLTEQGYKAIETVTLQDRLLTHTGAFKSIVNCQRKLYSGKFSMICVKGITLPIVSTPEHPYYARLKGTKEPSWIPANELTTDYEVAAVLPTAIPSPILEVKQSYGEALLVQLQAYMKGQDTIIENILRAGTTHYVVTESDCCLDHHDKYIWKQIQYTLVTVDVSDVPVYNFEVAEDNSYVVENTVVHNCQGFSHAGKKRTDDKRNELVHEFARVARIIKPRWIIGENVKGLLSRKGHDPADPPTAAPKPVIEIIKRIFEEAGYKITYKVVNATTVGVPQLRKRLIIVGFRSTQWYPHVTFPSESHEIHTIRPFLESHLQGATPLTVTCPDPHFLIDTTQTISTGSVHPNLQRLAAGLRNRSTKEKTDDPKNPNKTITEPDGLISFGRRKSGYHGEVVDPDGPSKTIICTYNLCPRLFVGLRSPTGATWVRTLSVTELAQIQGFPADFPWQGGEKAAIIQIGNAVPPPLATAIATALNKTTFKRTPQEAVEEAEDAESEEEIAE